MSDAFDGDEFPKEGATLRYIIEEFVPSCGGEAALQGVTTGEVCKQLTKRRTKDLKCSFCIMMKHKGHPAFSKNATVFISHAHQYLFLDVLNALQNHLGKKLDTVIWFDLFSINQHLTNDWSFEWLSTTFEAAVGDFGHVIMVMSPWNNPLPYTRAWCVFEAYCAAKTESKFEIAMSQRDRDAFLKDVKSDPRSSVNRMLATIHAEHSQSSKPKDRDKIFDVILKEVGFSKLNALVFECYREWVIATSLSALPNYTIDSIEHLQMLCVIGVLLMNQGDYDQAEPYLQNSLNKYKDTLGENHPNTLTSMINLADLYESRGHYKEAEPLYLACWTKRKESLGETHPDTLTSMNSLAGLYDKQCRYKEAEPLYLDCWTKRKDTLDENHPDTLGSMNNLALLYRSQGRYDEAEPLYLECLTKRRDALGETHPDTLGSMNNLAVLYRCQDRCEEAEPLYLECWTKHKDALGENHPSTLDSMNNLAILYKRQGRYKEAELLYLKCLEKRKALFGANHYKTLAVKRNLDRLFLERDKGGGG